MFNAATLREPDRETLEAMRLQLASRARKHGGPEMYDETIDRTGGAFKILWTRKSDG